MTSSSLHLSLLPSSPCRSPLVGSRRRSVDGLNRVYLFNSERQGHLHDLCTHAAHRDHPPGMDVSNIDSTVTIIQSRSCSTQRTSMETSNERDSMARQRKRQCRNRLHARHEIRWRRRHVAAARSVRGWLRLRARVAPRDRPPLQVRLLRVESLCRLPVWRIGAIAASPPVTCGAVLW